MIWHKSLALKHIVSLARGYSSSRYCIPDASLQIRVTRSKNSSAPPLKFTRMLSCMVHQSSKANHTSSQTRRHSQSLGAGFTGIFLLSNSLTNFLPALSSVWNRCSATFLLGVVASHCSRLKSSNFGARNISKNSSFSSPMFST